MPESNRSRRRTASIAAAIAVLVVAALVPGAFAQGSDPFGLQPKRPPSTPPSRPPSQGGAPVTPASPAIARVEGRTITQVDFDRVATPYFRTLKGQLGAGFTADMQRLAEFNVLDELIRRELLSIECQRRNIQVTQQDIDALLMQDPFFLTNGKFDPVKFANYKATPGTNYLDVLPRLREMAAVNKLDQSVRKSLTPTPAQVRAEWSARGDQVRFKMLPILAREISIDGEATEEDWARYFREHPDQFMKKTRVRLRYARLPLPPEGDSTRAAAEAAAVERARGIADSLRRGTMPDTAAGLMDTGLFEIPAPAIPGLGRVPGLADTLNRMDADSTIRMLGPYTMRDAVIVGRITEREPRRLPPMRDVLGDVRRRADQEKRRLTQENDRRAFFDANRIRWRGPRASLTRVTLDPATIALKPPAREEIDRWYAEHGRTLFGLPDTAAGTGRTWMPPLTDSLRTVAAARMTEGQRPLRAAEVMARIAGALRGTKDARGPARANGAVAETLTLSRTAPQDSLFPPGLTDSLLASAMSIKGALQGPRDFGSRWAVWRIEAADTAYIPTYEAVKARSDQEFAEDRRRKDEEEGRTYFDAHRDEFTIPIKYALDYVGVPIPPADSVRVPEAEIRRRYEANKTQYRQEEQVKARHILFMTREPGPDVERKAKARADSLLEAIRKNGGDFAELAKQFSQEPGAPTSGGDLGWFGRGRMVREFETAAFALKPGEISPVVKTQFGFHIIKLEDRRAAGIRPFDDVRGEIRTQIAQARGDSTAERSANTLRRRLAAGVDAKAATARYGGLITTAPITATEALPAIGVAQGLAQDLPTLQPGRWAPHVYRAGSRYLAIRLREIVPSRLAEFDEVRPQTVEAMKAAKRREALDRKVAAVRSALAAGATLDSLAAPYGGLKDSGLLVKSAPFVPTLGNEPRVVEKAFAMKPGEVSDSLHVALGMIWLRVEDKQSPDPAGYKAAAAQIEAELAKRRYDEWVAERKKGLKIEILRADLKGPRPSPFRATMGG